MKAILTATVVPSFTGHLQGLDQAGWTIVAAGDFDQDEDDDLLRRNGDS